MIKNACGYLVREGICGVNIDVCCIYQNSNKYHPWDKEYENLYSPKETFCDYPNVCQPNSEYANAIMDIARHIAEQNERRTT